MNITYHLRTVKRITGARTGSAYIMARAVVPGLGRSEPWATGYRCHKTEWHPTKKTVKGRPDLQAALTSIRERAAMTWADLVRAGRATPVELRRAMLATNDTAPITMANMLDGCLAYEATRPDIEADTLGVYRRYVTLHLAPALTRAGLQGAHPSALTAGHIRSLYNDLAARVKSVAYLRKVIGYLSTCYTWAIREGRITANPCQGLRLPKPRKAPDRLTADEVTRLLAAADRSGIERLRWTADLFRFQVATGLNYQDAVTGWPSARVLHVDGVTLRIVTRAKSRARQGDELTAIVPVLPDLDDLLARYPEGLPWRSGQKLNGYLKELAALAGIDRPVSSKWARATYAQRMYDKLPREVVQALLGHRDRSTLASHYAMVSPEKVVAELRRAGLV